jgi:hypothetical protein
MNIRWIARIGVAWASGVLLLGACADEEAPADRLAPPPAAPKPAAKLRQPAPARSQPAEVPPSHPASASDRERLLPILTARFPDAPAADVECLTDAILAEQGFERFHELVALRLTRRTPNARDEADLRRLDELQVECGLEAP